MHERCTHLLSLFEAEARERVLDPLEVFLQDGSLPGGSRGSRHGDREQGEEGERGEGPHCAGPEGENE